MLKVNASIEINSIADAVMDAYLAIENWPKLFRHTIDYVHLLHKTCSEIRVKVHHRFEGGVQNLVSILNDNTIRLEEIKPKYKAVFINRFISTGAGKTNYCIEGFIELKGFYKLVQPFLRKLVRRRIEKFVLLPMKEYVESSTEQLTP